MSKSFTWETIVNSSCKKCYQTISDPKKYQKIIPGPMEISKVTKTDIGWQWVMEGKAPMLGDTEIKIISENYSRKLKPNYYLVLPWHFKREILIREKKIREKGTKFIFPLPRVKVV